MRFSSLIRLVPLALASVLATGCYTTAGDPKPAAVPVALPKRLPAEPKVRSAFVMLGNGPVYLSALSGGYQVVLAVDLSRPDGDPVGTYADDRRRTGEPVYTLISERLVFQDLVGPAHRRTTFKGSLVRGRPGEGGRTFLADVLVTVKRVVYARSLASWGFGAMPFPPAPQTLLFGDEGQLYAMAIRTHPDDGARIDAVRITGGVLNEAQAAAIRVGALLDASGLHVGRQMLPVEVETIAPAYRDDRDDRDEPSVGDDFHL